MAMIKELWSKKTGKGAAAPQGRASPKDKRPQEKQQMSPEPTTSKGSASGAAAPASAAPGERQPATIRYLDRADMEETFADSITGLIFDGQTLRIEFGVTRFDDVKANAPITGRRYPACRLVLPPAAAVVSHQPHAADRGGADAGRRGEIAGSRRGIETVDLNASARPPRPLSGRRRNPDMPRVCRPRPRCATARKDARWRRAWCRRPIRGLDIKVSLCLYCRPAGALLEPCATPQ